MGIEKTRPLVRESAYWVNMNTDIENNVRPCATCLEYQQTQPLERIIPYELLQRSWEVVGVDIFMINNKMLLYTVEYYSKFPDVKKMGSLAADNFVQMTKRYL